MADPADAQTDTPQAAPGSADPAALLAGIEADLNDKAVYPRRVIERHAPRLLAAIRAVLELHQPVTTNGGWLEGPEWQECEACGPNNDQSGVYAVPGKGETFWPCPTVRAITRELTGKEPGDGH